eukprot:scaffold26930_cov108-Isochrysis_galbana.AAC.1
MPYMHKHRQHYICRSTLLRLCRPPLLLTAERCAAPARRWSRERERRERAGLRAVRRRLRLARGACRLNCRAPC